MPGSRGGHSDHVTTVICSHMIGKIPIATMDRELFGSHPFLCWDCTLSTGTCLHRNTYMQPLRFKAHPLRGHVCMRQVGGKRLKRKLRSIINGKKLYTLKGYSRNIGTFAAIIGFNTFLLVICLLTFPSMMPYAVMLKILIFVQLVALNPTYHCQL